jgi:hypothetical protein
MNGPRNRGKWEKEKGVDWLSKQKFMRTLLVVIVSIAAFSWFTFLVHDVSRVAGNTALQRS